ncbi:MAG: thioredoxin domain-containing protein [Pseudomonadota bacterium]
MTHTDDQQTVESGDVGAPSSRRRFLMLGAVALTGAAVWQGVTRVRAGAAERRIMGAASAQTDIVAVTFASAWCGPCKILQPRLAAVRPDFAGNRVRFITLDFTMGAPATYPDLAVTEGFSAAYARYEGATGFTVLVNRHTGDIVDVLTADYSKADMRTALTQALKQAQA